MIWRGKKRKGEERRERRRKSEGVVLRHVAYIRNIKKKRDMYTHGRGVSMDAK